MQKREEAPSRLPSYHAHLEAFLRCFTPAADTRFYAGVDLHARSLFLAVLDRDGQPRCGRNLPAAPQPFLRAVQPFRDGLVVGCECVHCWYWLADTCRDHTIPFVLGHAWAMAAIHGKKTTCDRHDAEALARLLKGGNFPLAYAYPRERRGLRDLLRARLRLVRQRAELYGHVHTARRQANLPPVSNDVKYKSKRAAITQDIADPFVRRRVATDLALLEPLDTTIRQLEAEIETAAYFRTAMVPGSAVRRWVGGHERDQREAVSLSTGLARRPSQWSSRPPPDRSPLKRRKSPDAPPRP